MDQQKQKILIIDDDRFLLNMYARKLDHSGYLVESAQGGVEALEKLKSGYVPDVILVDIIMPGMDGITLVKEIRKQQLAPRAKVIMLTNQSDATDMKAATENNIDGYIIKAVTIPSEVVTKMREVLAGKKIFSDPF
ncbi:MAG TPA: response regulator [Candidatus Paceibacterota bacterium]|nr:response regulator [Candidatus Paceibacterota bacterium]